MSDPPRPTPAAAVRARSPGRVNLIGDHTDYNEGLALPMAVDLGTTVTFLADEGTRVVLRSSAEPEPADVELRVPLDPRLIQTLEPSWARYVAAVVAAVRPGSGGTGTVESTLPIGAGLSSSAALEVATALALGCEPDPLSLARTCQHAEHAATGVPTGIMDQLVVSAARQGSALLIDFADLAMRHVEMPATSTSWWCTPVSHDRWNIRPTRSDAPNARPPRTVWDLWGGSTLRSRRPSPMPCCDGGPATSPPNAPGSGPSPPPWEAGICTAPGAS